MSPWYYFNRPTNLAFHDLTTRLSPPKNLRSLLGLSLKFIPTRRYSPSWSNLKESLWTRFERDFRLRVFFSGTPANPTAYNPRMYASTGWTPSPKLMYWDLQKRLTTFQEELQALFKKTRSPSNLLPHQSRALASLREQHDFLVVQCDKNLGPAIIERTEYIQMAFRDHLNEETTYQRIGPNTAKVIARTLHRFLEGFIRAGHNRKKNNVNYLTKGESTFLLHHLNANKYPFPTFYLTMKVHKTPLKSRPIVSCSGSLLWALGVWVDSKLQTVAKHQRSYFKSSFELKQQLTQLELPPNTYLATADAVSMYTNIPTAKALDWIEAYLHKNFSDELPVGALMQALRLIMTKNVFAFGDTHWKQLSGTAMGTPPAPPYATVYYALLEDSFLDAFKENLFFYRRFIDDGLILWTITDPHSNPTTWDNFQSAMNNPDFELVWEFTDPSQQVDFMDLTISICGDHIETSLYEKPSNLHLYIPPHSCHPPGLLTGIVHGMIFRIYTLCSAPADRKARTQDFYHRLLLRGYREDKILSLFSTAITRAEAYTGPVPVDPAAENPIFLHLQYHPRNPPSGDLQAAWKNCVLEPPNDEKLEKLKNQTGHPIALQRMTVAYHRGPNLGNLLSYRKLPDDPGPPVSHFARDL